jgi:hypothetical protein
LHEFWTGAYLFSEEEEAAMETMCKMEMIDQSRYLEQSSELFKHVIFSGARSVNAGNLKLTEACPRHGHGQEESELHDTLLPLAHDPHGIYARGSFVSISPTLVFCLRVGAIDISTGELTVSQALIRHQTHLGKK